MTVESSPSVYVDESVHDCLGFIVTAFIFANNDLTASVANELQAIGLIPRHDEFKSSALMSTNSHLRDLREKLIGIASKVRIGALVSAAKSRRALGRTALWALGRILERNGCPTTSIHVYMDQGMFSSSADASAHLSNLALPGNLLFHFEQDSRAVLGLQVADAVAHTLSQILREALGDLVKTVVIGDEGGYNPPIEPPLGWDLKTWLRYSFFHSPVEFAGREPEEALNTDLLGWGVIMTDDLDPNIQSAVNAALGKLWLGCIH